MTDVLLLGPLELGAGVDRHGISAGKQRALLAALALQGGTPVSTAALSEVVWGEKPPATAAKLLHIYVSQLRKRLPDTLPIVTREAGYCLDVDHARVDALLFRDLVREGRRAKEADDTTRAERLLSQALALWRGEPLSDLPPALLFDREAEQLTALWIDASEDAFALRLARGESTQLTPALEALTQQHPLREGLHASLALALYRSGRQAEALASYDALRTRLSVELGVDPGPALRDLHLRMLRQDPGLDGPRSRVRLVLPAPLTSTIGRDAELAALQHLLVGPDHRLVTLTGPGGSGKTRLSLVAASRVTGSFPSGVTQVTLETVRDPEVALITLATALGVLDPGRDPVAAMSDQLAETTAAGMLVVLDNLEQVVGIGPSLTTLLGRLPGLTLLVTSRILLGVEGEHAFPVQPLALPTTGRDVALHDIHTTAAVALFCERARAALPSFVLDMGNAAAVAELCRRLDGLPLALELAAAQTRIMTPSDLLARWTGRLDTAGAPQQDRPPRHHSLRSALDGSYELLGSAARELLAAASVFAGGFDLAAAEGVCGARPQTIAELLDHSLLQSLDAGGLRRLRMLETVREFGAEQGVATDLATRHADYYLALAEEAGAELGGARQAGRLAQLDREQDNLRAAFETLRRVGDAEGELRLAVALARYWYVRGHLGESRARLSAALERAAGLPPQLRADALRKVSANAVLRGDYAEALLLVEQALALYDAAGDRLGQARSLSNLGAICHGSGDLDRAAASLDEAVVLGRELAAERVVALALNNRGDLCLTLGDHELAAALFEQSHALLVSLGDDLNIARSLLNRGLSAMGRGATHEASDLVRRSLELSLALDDGEDIAWGLLARAAALSGEGDADAAAVLLGASEARLLEMEGEFKPYERRLYDATRAALEDTLGEVGLYEARAWGSALSTEAAVALALV